MDINSNVTFVPLREMKASRGKVISDKDLEILLDRSDLLGEDTHMPLCSFQWIRLKHKQQH